LGTKKIGWIIEIISDKVLDPLFARIAVFESGSERIAFVQLDTLGGPRELVEEVRAAVEGKHGFPGERVMVSGTHNHAGPDVSSDEAYRETLVGKVVSAFGGALENLQDAELGFGSTFEWGISQNRRVVMRDGTAKTHGSFEDPNALFLEGPIDPEVWVLAARSKGGETLGAIVNFACHPTHHGGETTLSAGYPGALAREMNSRGVPVALFLNGAAGNIHHADATRVRPEKTKEEMGAILAEDVSRVVREMEFTADVKLGCRSKTVRLPFRRYTDDDIRGTAKGAQRFVDPTVYDRNMPDLVKMIDEKGFLEAEVQVMFLGECAVAGIPSDYFVQHGLRIKEESFPRHALVSGYTNGGVGYCPHEEAFSRGGYETTFGTYSKMAPEAGRLLADCAIELVGEGP
jgi:hypothetical protein